MKHSYEQMRVLHQISKSQHFVSQNLISILLLVHCMLRVLHTLLLLTFKKCICIYQMCIP